MEQRLPPGTKLSESALCEAFGVGRMRIRRVLLLLASQQIVDLHTNRGAYVASPSAEQAHEVFEARLMLEPIITRLAVTRASDDDLARLADHVEREHQAHHDNKRREAICLSGQFHGLLAQVAGNSVMHKMMRELITRTSLIISLYGAQDMTDCRDHDHARIIDAIRSRDADGAARLMHDHLQHIQNSLDLGARERVTLDIVSILKR
ncbi:GntR family transcriptional regulator [Paracoccus sp. DMF-8]|uniref:GntR family transcriptional regulator n=1 Tax=Paracoccus sp. DMF-8 TaxID=3019445 RepID=UPI0023E3849D|nr:GntR family transcriptional regulator [Paracoccus sp. DMF-8]MDF3607960.1 GntR family transcriptional regulator [Paracoccus sp. DMF-8]